MENSTYGRHAITAFFDTRAAAEKAKADVLAAGISGELVKIVAGQPTTTSGAATQTHDVGFWESLKEIFMPDEDRHTYAEGLRRGGFLLTAQTDEAHYDRVLEILDADGSVDMDQRETQWRSEGWNGQSSSSNTAGAMSTASTGTMAPSSPSKFDQVGLAGRQESAGMGAETLQRAEETLRVGKRDVNHGRVRLRSYVVETPVHESVSLHPESVAISRRPVDRPLAAGESLFQERTIEAEEHEEVAVVSKEARVIEEVSLGKTVQERTQEIADTVRRTEVEVDDGRNVTGSATASSRFALADAPRLITEHMDVLGSDGTKVGTVDHLDTGERIKLAKNTAPDGQHHFIPLSWVDHVDQHVHLNKTVQQIHTGWN